MRKIINTLSPHVTVAASAWCLREEGRVILKGERLGNESLDENIEESSLGC